MTRRKRSITDKESIVAT